MMLYLVSVFFVSSLFGHTNGLFLTPGHHATQPQLGFTAGDVKEMQKDCYTPYDRMPFVKLTPCTQAMVDQINGIIESKNSGCIDASHQGVLRMPREGCAKGAVICPYTTAEELVLKFGSYASIAVLDTGAQLRSTSVLRSKAMGVAPYKNFYVAYANLAQQENYIGTQIAKSMGHAVRGEAGRTVEGREIHVVKITGPNYVEGQSKKLLLTFQLHAREWISGMAGVYAIENLISERLADPNFLNNMQVVIMPNCNPDGFVYAWESMRLWRKNRKVPSDGTCAGVDLNRNFPKDWGGSGSTSTEPCAEVYIGPANMSENESIAIGKIMDTNVQVHIDFHSYSELILRPWSYSMTDHPQRAAIDALGQQLLKAVQNAGTNPPNGYIVNYQYGGSEILYPASGVLPDYTTERGAYGYTVELSPNTDNIDGFELGPEHIDHVTKEAFAIIKSAITYIKNGGVANKVPLPPPGQKFPKIRRPMMPVH